MEPTRSYRYVVSHLFPTRWAEIAPTFPMSLCAAACKFATTGQCDASSPGQIPLQRQIENTLGEGLAVLATSNAPPSGCGLGPCHVLLAGAI
jgi:hypothetical protein